MMKPGGGQIGQPMQSELNAETVQRYPLPVVPRRFPEDVFAQQLVHVVDDDVAIRQSLQRLLHVSGYNSLLYASAAGFLASTCKLVGGCLLLDLKMPRMGGLELQRRLTELGVHIPVIVMTAESDVSTAVDAMKAGAIDFIEKPFGAERLIGAIERAFATQATPDLPREAEEAAKRVVALSRRERAVLDALVMGRSNKQIAHDLGLSVRTIEAHRARMMDRLKTRSLAEAVRIAVLATLALRP